MRARLLAVAAFAAGCANAAQSCPVSATLAWQAAASSINQTTPGAADNKYGFEDGIVVRRENGTFVMIAAEMYGDPKWVASE